MNKTIFYINLMSMLLISTIGLAQQRSITGKVTDAHSGQALAGVTISVGTNSSQTNAQGIYQIYGASGQTITFKIVGYANQQRPIGSESVINITLSPAEQSIAEVEIVGALGMRSQIRSFGTSVQSVSASDVADTRRENFINALQGRVAGLEVTSTSGVPGASSMMLLRGVSSINGNNQPLIVIDGLPINNNTMTTGGLASSSSSASSFENRGVDFTNRSSDFNAEDLESITILKGPEAAALYGIEAANGAIIITTKRGKAGAATITYNSSLRTDILGKVPEVQRKYDLGANGLFAGVSASYWGPKYDEGVQFYDNAKDFFRTPLIQNHNLSAEGGNEATTYRVSAGYVDQIGVVPNTNYERLTLTSAINSRLKSWLNLDMSLQYSRADNDQVFKGAGGPLMGLLIWPQTDNAKDYLNLDGSRRRYFTETGDEVDNPYYNVNKNLIGNVNNRIVTNTGLTINFTNWLTLDSKFGYDLSMTEGMILRHPHSNYAYTVEGRLDIFTNNQRNFSLQNVLRAKASAGKVGFDFMLGQATNDRRGMQIGNYTERFMDPNFISIDNSAVANRWSKQTLTRYRLVGVFGQFQANYDRILYLTITGRNDWSSTLPIKNQSFFYPSASLAFNFSDMKIFEGNKNFYGKLRAAIAQVGRDARPYGIYPSLEYKIGAIGGYGYAFTAPNPDLRPEMATSMEFGADFSFFKDRIGLNMTYFKKKQVDQIIAGIRSSYGTGFILKDMNGGETRSHGYEIQAYGKPIVKENFDWKINLNFGLSRNKVTALPADLPETYNSDTWLYGAVRNGNVLNASTMALTGTFFMRNNNGDLLINPTSGLPIREGGYVYAGHDRWPDFTIGLENSFRYKDFNLSFLLDIRKGGDVLNGTEHYLTVRGLSNRTLDRETPRVVKGVFRDGLENTDNPTQNNVVIIPHYANGYYTGMSEEFFIEKDINWLRMRDVRLSYTLPKSFIAKQKIVRSASVFFTATDLFLITNYSGLDPIVNGNTAALGGGGGYGIDYGNFPMPIGLNFGVRVGF